MEATSNAELLKKLDQWALERKISPKSFDCANYQDCNGSLQKKGLHLKSGYTCTMSYVGREYGEAELVTNKPFRMVIVGIDPGANYEEEELWGFIESQKGIEKWFYGSETKFNQQYRGVIRTASAILGAAGKHCLDHCYPESRCLGDGRPNGERCVLRSFAQPNLVKCAPAENENREVKSTPVMFKNCPLHLLSEIEVLKPDLLVFHGVNAEWAFPNAIEKRGYGHLAIEGSPKHGAFQIVHEVTAPGIGWRCFVLYLMHPSHGGLNRQWPDVERALELLRSNRAIPPL